MCIRDRPECVACCGISISGHVLETGRISASSQLQWVDVDGVGILESTLDMPAFVENDCKAALLGEQHLLSCAGESTENIAYLKLGWAGVGSAAIVDGRLDVYKRQPCPRGDTAPQGLRSAFHAAMRSAQHDPANTSSRNTGIHGSKRSSL